MNRRILTCLAVALASTLHTAYGEDLGVKAQTYALDPDASDQIKDALRRKQQTGELDRFWRNYRDRVLNSIKNPPSLGIPSDYASRTELHDLRFVIPSDYKDQDGNVIVRRGTVVQPLKVMPLTYGLLFIDGTDPRQVAYAVRRSEAEPLKIVLTAGSPYLMRIKYKDVPWHGGTGVPFYFDQRKMIINTLSKLYGIEINSVPAALFQQGDKLAIQFGMGDAN
ncbi:conjugal transfer pilus assembly protein TraW [Paraburkholderia fungorum]|jgi:conjugal transfer pilus assembly protein TraW|uniref:conjugal transfer protein n=1 Tax=Paraburkholderia fungorum TaxID=134537 RepID=UPI000D07685D|nr:conjugal transfer protein [Paraburkholderia fungorum]PRZ44857.1 conjugal transfer pilus assembly protein TraW [Paraburkholderia fungorum]